LSGKNWLILIKKLIYFLKSTKKNFEKSLFRVICIYACKKSRLKTNRSRTNE